MAAQIMAARRAPQTARCGCRPLAIGILGLVALSGCGGTTDEKAAAAFERLDGKVKFAGQAGERAIVEVDLSRTSVTDSDLGRLSSLARLESLNLSKTATTDRGLSALRNLVSLKKLNLNLTKISDAGLANLATLPVLEELYLIETPLTDASVANLKQLVHLKRLVLLRTRLSAAAIKDLRRQLPKTSIEVEPGPGTTP